MKHLWILPFCLLSLSIILTPSCNFTSFKKEIKSCDSLIVILDSTEAIFAGIDSAKYIAIHHEVKERIQAIENHYRAINDTMPKKQAFMLSDYRMVFKGVKRFNQHYQQHKAEIKYTKNQLTNLKTDLQNKAITKPLATRFLVEEARTVSELSLAVKSFDVQNKSTYEKYQSQNPVMVQFLDSLNNSLSAKK
jgi:predicted RNA-binding protein with EMAP domain